jgi:hypothetical protein
MIRALISRKDAKFRKVANGDSIDSNLLIDLLIPRDTFYCLLHQPLFPTWRVLAALREMPFA